MNRILQALCALAITFGIAASCTPMQPPVRLCSPQAAGAPCEARLTRYVEISPSFSQAERASIIDGAAMWEAASGGAVRFEVCVPDSPCPDPVTVRPGTLEGFVGLTEGERRVTLDVTAIAKGVAGLTGVAAHEFGHTLGIVHSPNPTDIMAPTVHSCMVITQHDLDALWDAIAREGLWERIQAEPIPNEAH